MARKSENKSNGLVTMLTKPKGRTKPDELRNPELREALEAAVTALRRIAEYDLERPIARIMQEMGERKEFLGKKEHDFLMALVEFSHQRTIDKLSAMVALKRLRGVVPDAVSIK